uniref:Putative RecA n=1 Tax=viral metagenome TaxID=1070528 RepID=A0A6M3INE2_9ZZZZ
MERKNRPSMSDQIVRHSKGEVKKERVSFISTGCIPLNLAASQRGIDGGWARGRVINIVGDGSSGKTALALEAAAWFAYNMLGNSNLLFPKVRKVRVRYNNVEGVMDFDLEEMYGRRFERLVEWYQEGEIEKWGAGLHRELLEYEPGVALLDIGDSLDAMTSKAGMARAVKKAEGKAVDTGTYGTEKAKYLSSEFFNNLCQMMKTLKGKQKDITIMLISQVRENLNAGSFGKKYYRVGGKAMDFYTHQVAWLYHMGKLKKEFKSVKKVYGVKTKAVFERSKVAPPFMEAQFPIIIRPPRGVDDIGAMFDFLGKKKDLEAIQEVEGDEALYKALVAKVVALWRKIEDGTKVERKRKYV